VSFSIAKNTGASHRRADTCFTKSLLSAVSKSIHGQLKHKWPVISQTIVLVTQLATLTMATVYFCTYVECDHASMSSLPVRLPFHTQRDINKSAQLRCSSTYYQEVTIALHISGWHWSMWAPSCVGFVSRCFVTFHITLLVLWMLRQLLQWLKVHCFCCTSFKPLFHEWILRSCLVWSCWAMAVVTVKLKMDAQSTIPEASVYDDMNC